MEHPFYQKSPKEQRAFQLKVVVLALLFPMVLFLLSWFLGFLLLFFVALPLSLSLIAPFLDVPAMQKCGALSYYSPMLLAEKPKADRVTLHGGTLLDYYFVIDRDMSTSLRKSFILQQYAAGLLKLIEHHNDQPQLRLRGTSYILNERTAERLGFRPQKTDSIQKLILVYNFFNITWCYSIARGRWAFPKLAHTHTFEATVKELSEKKARLTALEERLRQRIDAGMY